MTGPKSTCTWRLRQELNLSLFTSNLNPPTHTHINPHPSRTINHFIWALSIGWLHPWIKSLCFLKILRHSLSLGVIYLIINTGRSYYSLKRDPSTNSISPSHYSIVPSAGKPSQPFLPYTAVSCLALQRKRWGLPDWALWGRAAPIRKNDCCCSLQAAVAHNGHWFSIAWYEDVSPLLLVIPTTQNPINMEIPQVCVFWKATLLMNHLSVCISLSLSTLSLY